MLFWLEMISWWEAEDVCESHGGYLAEVKTEDQQTFLVREMFYENLHWENIQ